MLKGWTIPARMNKDASPGSYVINEYAASRNNWGKSGTYAFLVRCEAASEASPSRIHANLSTATPGTSSICALSPDP